MLPLPVLKKAQKELIDYAGTGMSVMEMSHRSQAYDDIITGAEAALREIMRIPDNYLVLFLQGGASSQFAMVPLNLFNNSKAADYIDTGSWSSKAIKEASRYGTANVVASSKDTNFNRIPEFDAAKFNPDADYFYICMNNTIEGTRYTELPETNGIPLVCDMSSNILSEEVNVSNFGLIFAGAQKNMGPAGVTVVIIRDDLVGHAMDITPTMFDYEIHAKNGSLYNTPPTYAIYICKLVYEWIRDLGGVGALQKINEDKAALLYDFLDASTLFSGTVAVKDRSLMNIPFVTPDDELNKLFIKEAAGRGLIELKGHRSVGGMRASIYNAFPIEGVKLLVEFMKEFETAHK
jgi:phosphoserine aminotransferase